MKELSAINSNWMVRFQSLLKIFGLAALLAGAAFATVTSVPEKDDASRLRWNSRLIKIAISRSLTDQNPNIKIGSDVAGAVERSLAAWNDVNGVQIVSQDSEKFSVSPAGVSGDGISLITIASTPENILFFNNDSTSLSARTRVFFNRRGHITEADIVLNPFLQFSTDGSYGTYDLEATLRHEIGHLLGLRHSSVIGSTMYDSASKNGVFQGMPRVEALSADDISNIRSLYGTNGSDDECCGSITGKIAVTGRRSSELSVWVQEKETGRIASFAVVMGNRNFKIGGLRDGDYTVIAKENSKKLEFAAQDLGVVTIAGGKSASFTARFARKPIDFSLRFLGTGGILSDSPIVVQKDGTYSLLAGGRNISSRNLQIAVDSPFITITSNQGTDVDYADGISAFSFELKVSPETPAGDYSVYAISADGERDYRIGGVTVSSR